MGRNSLASRVAQKLVELNTNRNYEYLKLLGVSYLMTGKNEDAEKTFSQMLQIDPTDGIANVHMGFAIKAQNRVSIL